MDLDAANETPSILTAGPAECSTTVAPSSNLTAGPAEPSATVTPSEVLRSIRISPVIKTTPQQHTNANNTLDEWTLNTLNVGAARTAIWNKFRD
ncbi:hypothetical protein HDU77_000250, partial [Chytriomyces hyalinus]